MCCQTIQASWRKIIVHDMCSTLGRSGVYYSMRTIMHILTAKCLCLQNKSSRWAPLAKDESECNSEWRFSLVQIVRRQAWKNENQCPYNLLSTSNRIVYQDFCLPRGLPFVPRIKSRKLAHPPFRYVRVYSNRYYYFRFLLNVQVKSLNLVGSN
jgi:hypothetical protein